MGIYVGDSEIKCIYLGDTPLKEVYLGDTKVRPIIRSAFIDFLLVGGGGSGGRSHRNIGGGGGGAGGVVYCQGYELSEPMSVTIGAGGYQSNGCSSCLGSIVAYGGGRGANQGESNGGCPGASGGGSTGSSGNTRYPAGTGCQGHNGGQGHYYYQGGGGGFCGVGGTACNSSSARGVGGLGYTSSISGTTVCYAGGGGGGSGSGACAANGCYGGGNGGGCRCLGCNATTCGSGGGGGGRTGSTSSSLDKVGGCGGNGVLIVRYPEACGYSVKGGDSCYLCNGYCIHCFTSDGTLTVS